MNISQLLSYCFLFFFSSVLLVGSAFAIQNTITDPNVELSLDYPNVVVQDKQFVLSSVIKASADQVSNITVTITCPELLIQQNSFHIDKLTKDSTLGNDFNAMVKEGVPDGGFVSNVEIDYFVKGFFDPQPMKHTITQTIQFLAESKPALSLNLQTATDVFAGEPFSVKGTITNQGSGAHNVDLSIYSSELQLSGKKTITITDLAAGKFTDFEFIVQTQKDLGDPVHATVHVNGTYSGDDGKIYNIDNSFSLFARQRGMLEIGDANGIWIGQFFIAPVVGVGTIVSSVIGFLIFVWHYKNKKKKRRIKK